MGQEVGEEVRLLILKEDRLGELPEGFVVLGSYGPKSIRRASSGEVLTGVVLYVSMPASKIPSWIDAVGHVWVAETFGMFKWEKLSRKESS